MALGFWKKLKKPIMVMAPMSGVTDQAFRLMFLKYKRPDVFYTEFVSADGLLSKGKQYCLETLSFDSNEHPIVAQVFGSNPEYFGQTAKLIAELGFDGIDINMGCPDKNVEKNGGGSSLINNPELAKQIIQATKKGAPNIPVSVKTRIGYDKNEIDNWITTILKENVDVLIVHFRTRKEMFTPPAHWELAKDIIKLRDKYSPDTLIIGNGDIKTLDQANQLIKETGLDGFMVGRALLGNPWFFSGKEPDIKERLNAIIEHGQILENFYKQEIGADGYCRKFNTIKKHFHGYTKGIADAKDLRESLMKTKSSFEAKKVIDDFLANIKQ
jgi:nifR3 family TIM-barrel protein